MTGIVILTITCARFGFFHQALFESIMGTEKNKKKKIRKSKKKLCSFSLGKDTNEF